jgi:cystathionine gamma-lyase
MNGNIRTEAIHAGEKPNLKEGGSGDVVIPIHLSSTFARKEVDIPTNGYEYSRSGNPTRFTLEKKLAAIEHATHALATTSGLTAQTLIALSILQSGDHVIASDDLYGGTMRLFDKVFSNNFNVAVEYVDATNPENIKHAVKENTKLIWLESPTNPMMKLSDIKDIKKAVKDILVIVDNTFMSPVFQNPLEQGADIVLHSTSKYINGHSDSIGGALMLNNKEIYKKLQYTQNAAGLMLSPFDSYLVARGLKTLHARMQQHEKNAIAIAKVLENHPKIEKVYYPGLESHSQHELAKTQMKGFGGMITLIINGEYKHAKRFMENLDLFSLAESLGGVESLVNHPARMTHASIQEEKRLKIGITDNLVRLSVGIEDTDDLVEDIKQALEKI